MWRHTVDYQKIKKNAKAFALFSMAVLGTLVLFNVMSKTARNARTNSDIEVHRVLGNPYLHLGDNVENHRIKPGQVYYVHNKYIKTDTCHVWVTNLLVDKASKRVHHYAMFVNWFEAGTYEFNEFFVMPEWIPEGHYNLIKKTVSDCNGLMNYSTNFNLELDVVN